MLLPFVLAGVKQPNQTRGIRIHGAQVWSFALVASVARPSEIVQRCRPAVLPGNYMFQMESQGLRQHIRQATVLAPVPGPFSHYSPLLLARHDTIGMPSRTRARSWASPRNSLAPINAWYSTRSSALSRPSLALSANSSNRSRVRGSNSKLATARRLGASKQAATLSASDSSNGGDDGALMAKTLPWKYAVGKGIWPRRICPRNTRKLKGKKMGAKKCRELQPLIHADKRSWGPASIIRRFISQNLPSAFCSWRGRCAVHCRCRATLS